MEKSSEGEHGRMKYEKEENDKWERKQYIKESIQQTVTYLDVFWGYRFQQEIWGSSPKGHNCEL